MADQTNQKVVTTYRHEGDVRRWVTYVAPSDGVGSDGTMGPGLTALITAFANLVPHEDTIISIVGTNPDKSIRSVTANYPKNNATFSATFAMSILAYHLVCKDSENRNCGHTFHLVVGADCDNPDFEVGAPISEMANAASWQALVDAIIAHSFTKSGKAYTAFLHTRMVLKRDRATGGRGRKLTTQRAIRFLRKNDPGALALGA
jgi:hypothetical protein